MEDKVFELDENIKLMDVISPEFLQKFQDAFSKVTGVASLTTDDNGVPVANGSNFTDFCIKMTRGSKEGLRRCMESDSFGGTESARTGKPAVYYCGSGLMDFGAPILLNGKKIGSILGGQVLPEAPEEEKFVKIAQEIGVDSDEYVAALRKVKIMPKEQLEAAADLLYVVASEISNMGYQRYIMMKMTEELYTDTTQIMSKVQELEKSAKEVADTQNALNNEIHSINEILSKIAEMTEATKEIANQTRVLGMNAAIEAARSGEAGAGFGVVAKEIQKLSNRSKETVDNIKQFTSQISDSVGKTSSMSTTTLGTTQYQETAIKSIVESIANIADHTEVLNKLASDKK